MIWLVFAILTVAAVGSVLWPLLRGLQPTTHGDAAVAFYKSQVLAIDRDRDSGLIAVGDAFIAKTEAARRLLADRNTKTVTTKPASISVRTTAILSLLAIPALALGLYGQIGRPDLPDAPLAARLAAAPESMDVPALIARLEAEVAARPKDGRGYELLAPIYMRLNRPEDAGKAYLKALELEGETARLRADYAETFVAVAEGKVTPEAKSYFEMALKADPALAKAQFYMGLAAEQAGDKAAALDIFGKLIATAPAGAPYVPSVSARIAKLGGVAPATPPVEAPSAAAVIAALPDAERQSTIRAMVEGLALRLAQNGRDEMGWLRLVRAFAVLNEPERAKSALADARKSFVDDGQALQHISALAKELGLEAP